MRHLLRAAALAVAVLGSAPGAYALETRSGERVAVSGEFSDALFAAGDEVDLNVSAADDVFAAGGDVSVTRATAPHLFLAGRRVSVVESNATDLIAAGAEIEVSSGQISDDVIAAGGRIDLAQAASIGGSVVLAGGELRIDAPIGADLRAVGESIQINNSVDGDVLVEGQRVVIGENARIAGNFTHRAASIDISPEAQILGEVRALPPRAEPDMRPAAAFAAVVFLGVLIGLIVMAMVAALLLPRLMQETSQRVRSKVFSMLGIGVVVIILSWPVIIALAMTLIGAPLAVAFGLTIAALWPISVAVAAYALGMWVRARLRKQEAAPNAAARALWTSVGMIVLVVIGIVPVIGWLIWWIAYATGLGALLTALRHLVVQIPREA